MFLDNSGRFSALRHSIAWGVMVLLAIQATVFTSMVLESEKVNSIFYYFYLLLLLLFVLDSLKRSEAG